MKITSKKVTRTIPFKYLRFSRETEQIKRTYSYLSRYVRRGERQREREGEGKRKRARVVRHWLCR